MKKAEQRGLMASDGGKQCLIGSRLSELDG